MRVKKRATFHSEVYLGWLTINIEILRVLFATFPKNELYLLLGFGVNAQATTALRDGHAACALPMGMARGPTPRNVY